MPFDSADFNPWNGEPSWKPRTFWKETILDLALGLVFIPSAMIAAGFVGLAIDGFPLLPPLPHAPPIDIHDVSPASFLAQAGAWVSFVFLAGAFVWWRHRVFMKKLDNA